MVDIRNEKDLETWLLKNSGVSPIVAIRSVLRVLPLFGQRLDTIRFGEKNWREKLALPVFDLLIPVGLRGRFHIDALSRFHRFGQSNSFSDLQAHDLDVLNYLLDASIHIYELSSAGGYNRNYIEFIAITRAFEACVTARFFDYKVFWHAISLDATAIESGVDLWTQPLWLDDIPEWAAQGWENLATELTKRTPYWKTLVRWYEDRLKGDDWAASQGRPAIRELEIARASLPDSYWKKGGKAVNLAIAELEDFFWNNVPLKDPALRELVNGLGVITDGEGLAPEGDEVEPPSTLEALPPVEALPEQSSSGMTFGRSAGGPIALAPPSGNDVLLATPDRIEDYLELRRKAMDVLAEGANRVGRLGKPLHFFCELPADLTAVRAKVLWGHINALRIVLKGHDEAIRAQAAGLDPDDRRLDGFAADGLQDIVETANVFFAGDPNLIELDAVRRGPREQADAKAEIAQIEKPLKEALNNGVITEGVTGGIVEEQITIALAAPDTLDGRQATELGAKTVRNYIAVFVRFVRSELDFGWKDVRKGVYSEAGKELFIEAVKRASPYTQEAIHYIAVHANELLGYVHTAFQNADLETLIRILSQLN